MTIGDVLVELFLAILGASIALWYEGLRRPRLVIEMHPPPASRDNPERGTRIRFAHLTARNVPRTRISLFGHQIDLPFLEPDAVLACEGTIRFLSIDGNRLHKRDLPIRWTGSPQPIKFELDPQGKLIRLLEPSLFPMSQTMNIPPDQAASFDVAVREDNDPNAYGWNHESYIHHWKHPDFIIPPGKYVIEVKLQSGTHRRASGRFYLINGPTTDEFVVEPLTTHA
jgi:hypothetical protein